MPTTPTKARKPRRVAGFEHGRVPGSVRAEQLLDVAEHLFAENGYVATPLEAIAKEAGVTRPLLYSHFGSRDDIYLACLRRARAQLEQMMFEAMAGAPGAAAKIERGADAYFRFVENDPARFRVLFGGDAALSGALADEAMHMHLATERRFAALLGEASEGHDEEKLLAFAHAIGGAGHQMAQWWLRTPGVPRKKLVAWYCAVTINGISALLDG